MMVTVLCLRAAHIATCVGYHSIGARVFCRVAVTSIAADARAGLTCPGVHVVVVGWIFGVVVCHATSKGAKLSCKLYYAISFWSWILMWKYLHFVLIYTFRGYYPHSV